MSAPAYIIFTEEIHNPDQVNDYAMKAGPTVAPFGGELVAFSDAQTVLEGGWHGSRVVIVKFKDVDTAKGWYNSDAYQEILPLRLTGTDSRSAILEGVEGADYSDCKCFFLVTQNVLDADRLAAYAAKARPITLSHGGVPVITSTDPQIIEGDWHGERIVMLGFRDADHAKEWYNDPAYQDVLGERLAAADCRAVLVPGL